MTITEADVFNCARDCCKLPFGRTSHLELCLLSMFEDNKIRWLAFQTVWISECATCQDLLLGSLKASLIKVYKNRYTKPMGLTQQPLTTSYYGSVVCSYNHRSWGWCLMGKNSYISMQGGESIHNLHSLHGQAYLFQVFLAAHLVNNNQDNLKTYVP